VKKNMRKKVDGRNEGDTNYARDHCTLSDYAVTIKEGWNFWMEREGEKKKTTLT
jgi:hypothetical protein